MPPQSNLTELENTEGEVCRCQSQMEEICPFSSPHCIQTGH